MDGTAPRRGHTLSRAATAVLAASAVVLLLLAVSGADFFDAPDDVLPACFAAAALLAIAGAAYERRAATSHREAARSASEAKRREAERELRQREEAVRREQRARIRAERARQMEREWARELRSQVLALHRRQGTVGDANDVRELILRIAIELVGAEKGLLLSRADDDHDGRLDLVTHRGFEHNPTASALAQHFAQRTLERDQILREDDPGAGDSPADREINSLIAVPVYIQDDFEGVVVCANRPQGFEELDDDVLLALGDHAGAVLQNTRLHADLRSSYLAVVRMLSDSIATKDPFGRTYSRQISEYVDAVARRLGLGAREREQLLFAALLRDVGKLGISERILLKPGPLTSEEWGVLRLHPQIGCRIVERVPGLNRLGPAIRHHQERWDGTGYPLLLSGEQIPLAARIVAVSSAFEAMVEGRPYRPSITAETACREILRCAGAQFDPEIAGLFVEEVRRRPLEELGERPVAEALDDPAVQARRHYDEPLLGHGQVGATDNVTLLYSHRYLLEYAEVEAVRARRRAQPFAVVIVELCDLERINRRDGYAAGDAALYDVARALEEALSETPAVAGRYSGRRLAAILPASGQSGATAAIHRLLRRVHADEPAVRTAVAVWQRGDHGDEVLARARRSVEREGAIALEG
jgi:diguanylate cyclase (GGDEF)-like protein